MQKLIIVLLTLSLFGCNLVAFGQTNPQVKRELKEISRTKNQLRLAELARTGADKDVRKAAIEKLTDQALLKDLILKGQLDYDCRYYVIARITDQTFLKELALNHSDWGIRCSAAEKIEDQDFLSRVAMNDESKYVRKEIVKLLTDPVTILRIYGKDRESDVQNAAELRALSDDIKGKLFDLAMTYEDSEIREWAADVINDDKLLTALVLESKDENVRYQAMSGLYDTTIAAKVVLSDPSPRVRGKAVYRIKNQALLYRVATSDSAWEVRENALYDINDQELLCHIAKSDNSLEVRYKAVDKIKDQTFLGNVALNDKNEGMRGSALYRLEDHASILLNAQKSKYENVREWAVEHTEDQVYLRRVARTDASIPVRRCAIEKVTDSKLLNEAARLDPDSTVRWLAIERMLTKEKNGTEYTVKSIKSIGDLLWFTNSLKSFMHQSGSSQSGIKTTDELKYENAIWEDLSLKAREGKEFVEVRLDVRPLPTKKDWCCYVAGFQLVTTEGKQAEPLWDGMKGDIGSAFSKSFWLQFIADKGAKFKTFIVDGVVIDLDAFQLEKPKSR